MHVETYLILFSWAVHLSPYSAPPVPPNLELKSHEFFVENACGGEECNVIGWFNGGNTIYIDRDYQNNDAIVVHEIVHWLQWKSGKYDDLDCADTLYREREAYRIQDEYLVKTGRRPIAHPRFVSCKKG